MELYALSVSHVQVAPEKRILGGKIVHTHHSGFNMGGVNVDSGETGLSVDRADFCWLSALVDLIFPF